MARAESELPQYAPQIHLGVKTCSSSNCHGKAAASGRTVLQNEHTTWLGRDRHAGAYEVLLEEHSREIAAKLGLPTAAHEASLCLDCHADNVGAERRGELFTLEDGVGCEACHGGSGPIPGARGSDRGAGWLNQHISGSGAHRENLELGLYPTDDAVARARLCVSCHFGSEGKFASHRLMGAGHPRLRFELDTFTEAQPSHFQVDADYSERGKSTPAAIQVWAIGQALLARERLRALLDEERGRDGIWVEFALLDCHACHHPMSERRWVARGSTGLGLRPGLPRFNDASLLMLRQALLPVDSERAVALRDATRGLHAAVSLGKGRVSSATRELLGVVEGAIPRLVSWNPDSTAALAIGRGLVNEALGDEYRDYAAAEQAVMVLPALLSALATDGVIGDQEVEVARRAHAALLEATKRDEPFHSSELKAPFEQIRSIIASATARAARGAQGAQGETDSGAAGASTSSRTRQGLPSGSR